MDEFPCHTLADVTPIAVFSASVLLLSCSAQAGQMEDDLINRFRAGYENQDANALLHLAYSDGLNESLSSNLRSQFQFNFMLNLKLQNLEIGEVPEGLTSEQDIDGVIYRPRLKPTAALKVTLYTLDDDGTKSLNVYLYLLGEHDGKLYITPDVPEP